MACYFNYFVDSVECSNDNVISKNHTEKEIQIVFTECGILPDNVNESSLSICSTHFSHILEINVKRSRRIYCEIPPGVSPHPEARSTRKNDKTTDVSKCYFSQREFGIILPVGTPVCANCRTNLCTSSPKESISAISDNDTCLSKDKRRVEFIRVRSFEQVEDQVKEMNENNLAMEELPSSEDKPSLSQPMDGKYYDTDSDDYRYDNVTPSPLLLQRGLRFGPIQRNGAN